MSGPASATLHFVLKRTSLAKRVDKKWHKAEGCIENNLHSVCVSVFKCKMKNLKRS